jgi:hypothetical protein
MYILYSFSPKNRGLSFQPSRNIIKWKWNRKPKPCLPIKSHPLSHGNGFSLNKTKYFTFIAKIVKKKFN